MKQNRLERCTNKYAELKRDNFKIMNLKKGELIKHCVDDRFMKFYKIGWAVTSEGRVWSLIHNKWLNPRNQKGYWRVANVYVHELVDYYFMTDEEKAMTMQVKEHNKKCVDSEKIELEVHHLKETQAMDSSVMTKEERIKACMESNHKGNLILQKKDDHRDSHKIMKGKKTKGEESGTEQFDCMTSILRNSNSTAYVSYDEQGKRLLNFSIKLKGTTQEEDDELDKITHRFLE